MTQRKHRSDVKQNPSNMKQNLTAKDGFVRGKPATALFGRRTLYILMGLGLMAFVAAGQIGTNGVFAFFKLHQREAELQQEVADLQAANIALDHQLESLANDPEALEKLAREKHNMRRRGEEVLHVLPPADKN